MLQAWNFSAGTGAFNRIGWFQPGVKPLSTTKNSAPTSPTTMVSLGTTNHTDPYLGHSTLLCTTPDQCTPPGHILPFLSHNFLV